MAEHFDHHAIEKAAREKWASLGLYKADLTDDAKEPYYLLVEFPYPSGDLHTGHWYAYAVPDIYARLLRARGKNVLFPIGFDAFGLPAENAAIKNGANPAEWTAANIERMRAQLATTGASFDWSREVVASDPGYYQWTQWLFAKLFEHGLAERREAPVKWCPKDQTVLANEQVIDGHCERCGSLVEEKILTQWFLKITDYAERLLKGLDDLPWREEIKDAQRAWIGKSEGMLFKSPVKDMDLVLETFSAHFEAFAADTFLVIAPDHPLLPTLVAGLPNEQEVLDAANKMVLERIAAGHGGVKELEGVFTGRYTLDPVGNGELPIWVANYALADYGTGIVKCSAHDERDYAFAKKYNIPLKEVLEPMFTQTSNSSAFRANEPYVDHHGVIVLLKHWSEEKYLCLRWKNAPDWGTLLTGTLDKGISPEETALEEIHEETGFKHARVVKSLGTVHGRYYHVPKQKNRVGHTPIFLIELLDGEREEISAEEQSKHELLWLSPEEMKPFLTAVSHQYALQKLMEDTPWTDMKNGVLTEPAEFAGKIAGDCREEIMQYLENHGLATRKTAYKLRDWLVSRQRYWGCPIPIVYDPEGKPHAVPAEHLPWLLPTDVDFKPTGKTPLASSKELQERVTTIFGAGWTPECDTLDTFVDSSWYFLRYLDPKNETQFSDPALMKKWLPVKRYSGGSEHTTMHLLYARFFTKALYDLALVPVEEPFYERLNRGIILGPDGAKMSKSKGNVINPDEYVEKYGADAVRVYLAFIGPYNEPGAYPWSLEGVASMRKFLDRVTRALSRNVAGDSPEPLARAFAQTAAKIMDDGERFKFNTAVAALMSLLNDIEKVPTLDKPLARDYARLLAPFAPHLAEHLWEALGGKGSVHEAPWPAYDAALMQKTTANVIVQVDGKRRGALELAPDAPEAKALAASLKIAAVAAALGGGEPARVVYVPGRVLNLVSKPAA